MPNFEDIPDIKQNEIDLKNEESIRESYEFKQAVEKITILSNLHEIFEIQGQFIAIVPGLTDLSMRMVFSVAVNIFNSREEAEDKVAKVKEEFEIHKSIFKKNKDISTFDDSFKEELEQAEVLGNIYSVVEIQGNFVAIVPGLEEQSDYGIKQVNSFVYEKQLDAEQAVTQSRKKTNEFFEKISLEKSNKPPYYKIEEWMMGKYKVTTPMYIDNELGSSCGFSGHIFENWEDAKDYYLKSLEQIEKLVDSPLLELQINDNEKIAFSDLDAFNPDLAPTDKIYNIPSSINEYLFGKEKNAGTIASASTYQETIKSSENWQRELYDFIENYLENNGAELLKSSEIKDLDNLSPKQAIELATQIVIDLTKYKTSDTKDTHQEFDEDGKRILPRIVKTKADETPVLKMLQEGIEKINDPKWEGNGVCRNFACAVKAIFEALKFKQTKFNKLRNTYCLYEGDSTTYAPKKNEYGEIIQNDVGHAWNTFVTVSKQGVANAVIIDVTWANRNLETKKVENLDYTLTRMEPVVNAVVKKLDKEAPGHEEQIGLVLSYYSTKLESLGDGHQSLENREAREFYAYRVLDIMKTQGMPKELPQTLVNTIEQVYMQKIDEIEKQELVALYEVWKVNSSLKFPGFLKSYLKSKTMSAYHQDNFIVPDDKLQETIIDALESMAGFDKFVKESQRFRVRVRDIAPAVLPEFAPFTSLEDALELRYLASNQQNLRGLIFGVDKFKPTEKQIKKLIANARNNLEKLDSNWYRGYIRDVFDDYDLIKDYDEIYRSYKKKQ